MENASPWGHFGHGVQVKVVWSQIRAVRGAIQPGSACAQEIRSLVAKREVERCRDGASTSERGSAASSGCGPSSTVSAQRCSTRNQPLLRCQLTLMGVHDPSVIEKGYDHLLLGRLCCASFFGRPFTFLDPFHTLLGINPTLVGSDDGFPPSIPLFTHAFRPIFAESNVLFLLLGCQEMRYPARTYTQNV